MQDSEAHQKEVAADIGVRNIVVATSFPATGQENHPSPEQHGENSAHLAFKEHPFNEEKNQVYPSVWANEVVNGAADGNVMESLYATEIFDIEDEDAK